LIGLPKSGFGRVAGGEWLIAPMLTSDDAVTVRLPTGRWRDDLGEEREGPKKLRAV